MEKNVDYWIEMATPFVTSLVLAIAIFVVGRLVSKLATQVAQKALTRAKVDETLVRFVGNLVYAVLLTFVILAALEKLGVKTTSFVAVIGAAGLAVGLALQGSLANFASGVMMIIFKPFKSGDFVEAAGTSGSVAEIGIFTTILKTPDNKTIIIPNSKITEDCITNFSAEKNRRIDLVVGVAYSDDLKKVRSVLEELVQGDSRILKDPEPTIAVAELADSSVNFVVRPWVNSADYWKVKFELTEAIKVRFDSDGISIPFPQRDVHILKEDAAV
jgi:small conductance mechanosensitive channel